MAFVKVGSLAKLPAGAVLEASVGEERYAICNLGGAVHALAGVCPHRGGPLGQGAVNDGNLTCPWHAWEFDCRTGAHDYNPALKVATFPVQLSGDDILIDIPSPVPELPEVETIVRGLAPRLAGARILTAEFLCPRVVRGRPDQVVGKTIRQVRRHGKYIVIDFAGGGAPLGIHLGMTGKLLLDGEPGVHSHAIFTLDCGLLVYDDIRQFGRIEWSEQFAHRLEKLGPDPLSIASGEFASRLRARRSMIKPLLLNQGFLRGLGNIYTDEALHRAGIHPRALASSLSSRRAAGLFAAIREVLLESIETGGSSVSDYVDAAGRRGSFQLRHRVYGKEGEPCPACGAPIRRVLVAQRGTHFCPRCQKR